MSDRQQIIDEAVALITKEFVEQGKLVEAGWAALRLQAMSPEASPQQVEQMRLAYFAGAQHLYASIMTMLDAGEEPTSDDLRRMQLIETELDGFSKILKASLEKAERSRGDA